MKLFFTLYILGTACLGAYSQGTSVAPDTMNRVFLLKETFFDFGSIPQGRPVTHEFRIHNGGSDTLKLENVQASCGCTTPVWDKAPVTPGNYASINVGYNSAAEGVFDKPVTIYYNGGQTKIITIKGKVFKSPATPAPINSSITLLKQLNK